MKGQLNYEKTIIRIISLILAVLSLTFAFPLSVLANEGTEEQKATRATKHLILSPD